MRSNRIGNEKYGYYSIKFTAEEEKIRDAEEVKAISKKLMDDWERNMCQSDAEMTRGQEDLIDHLINDHGQTVEPVLKARRDKKKEIRSRRPKEDKKNGY